MIIICFVFQRFDRLFDIMNSRTPVGKYTKAPMTNRNWAETAVFLVEMKEYIPKISTTTEMKGKPAGTPYINTMRYAYCLRGGHIDRVWRLNTYAYGRLLHQCVGLHHT